ncbi:MAG: carboxyl transferase domain-containing protein [Myxococcota bacterium]
MKPFQSRLDSDSLRLRRAAMLEKWETIQDLQGRAAHASAKKKARFEERGQLPPRERVRQLLDPGTELLHLCSLAGFDMHDDGEVGGGGSVAGLGRIEGRRCLVLANDSGIKGGSISPSGLRKTLRMQEIALRQRLPLVYLVESGGANLMYQAELFVEGGRSFANQARLSAAGVPQIAIVHGSSTAGGAYLPGLSDYVVLVKKRSKVFLAGPPLVKAALGEEANDEELGGSHLHAKETGLGEYLAQDDEDALAIARRIVRTWGPAESEAKDAPEPRYDPEELLGVFPESDRTPLDVREVLLRLVDGSEFLEFKAGFGAETVCAHADLGGFRVGLLGNNGPIRPAGSQKAAQFIQLCERSDTALVFLQNTTGYMVGKAAERAGAIKHGSKMIQAVANARVPRLTIILGGSYGAGNYGMCGRGFDPDFIFAWPTARTAVMGPQQAAEVMKTITRAKFERDGLDLDESALEAMSGALREQLERESTAVFGSSRLWDDGVIDPRRTREVLMETLAVTRSREARAQRRLPFGLPRF